MFAKRSVHPHSVHGSYSSVQTSQEFPNKSAIFDLGITFAGACVSWLFLIPMVMKPAKVGIPV